MTDEKVIKMINEALWADSIRIRSRVDTGGFLSGFYRYRTGMNVRVVGRYHECPTVELIDFDGMG